MCEHLVCLALTIPKLIENNRKKPGESNYVVYENKLLERYKERKAEFLERERIKKQEEDKQKFLKVLSDFRQLYYNVPLVHKISLELYIYKYEQNYSLSLKVGTNRMYIVKDINQFLNAVKNSDLIKYGKYLSFYYDLNNFDKKAKDLISLLILRTNYWVDELHPYINNQKDRYLQIDINLLCEIFAIYTNNYFEYEDTKIYISEKR